MATKIYLNTNFTDQTHILEPLFKEVYCLEDPHEVLFALGRNFNIGRYKNIGHSNIELGYVESKQKATPRSAFYSLEIKEADDLPLGVNIDSKLADIKIPVDPKQKPGYLLDDKQMFISALVKKYLVDVKSEPVKNVLTPRNKFSQKRKVVKADNYLETRKDKKDREKEALLNQVLEFSSMILNKSVDATYLESLDVCVPDIGSFFRDYKP